MQYILQFFNAQILFNPRPVPVGAVGLKILMLIVIGFFLVSILLKIQAKKFDKASRLKAKAIRRIASNFTVFRFLFALYLWFVYEGLPILSMRLWFLVLVLFFISALFFPVRYYFVKLPILQKERAEKKEIKNFKIQ